ncbi:MAG: diguanylate cyclase [Gemmatimonadota bacterium]|nr:diguanylate cyclase [Gemmatimonadota bacterium]
MAHPPALFFSPDALPPPPTLKRWLEESASGVVITACASELMGHALRGRTRVVAFDARTQAAEALRACERLKRDPFTGIIPAVVLTSDEDAALAAAYESGADEVIRSRTAPAEVLARLDAMLRRAERDLHVQPTTRLPGPPVIEREIRRRIDGDDLFAVCYADLDHFKEYNDRYSYAEGDRVIRMVARILHDVVAGLCPEHGFVGHIGGDDFIFIVPLDGIAPTCREILDVFELLVPYQYSEQDRRAGYYFGKDRRGQLHRVPLMTLSIGIVTSERRRFTHPAQVSELATEMKSYAKTLTGSVFVVDRRHDGVTAEDDSAPEPNFLGAVERK